MYFERLPPTKLFSECITLYLCYVVQCENQLADEPVFEVNSTEMLEELNPGIRQERSSTEHTALNTHIHKHTHRERKGDSCSSKFRY